MKLNKFSIDNVAFGMGGALLQHSNRDTFKFAMKASATKNDRGWVDVYKDPVTDTMKHSKKGRMTLVKNKKSGQIYTCRTPITHPSLVDMMSTVYKDGEIVKEYTFEEVRNNAASN